MKPIINKRAYFDYEILEKCEAGLVLLGFEVKAIKNGWISLKGSFAVIKDEEAYLLNAHITPYQPQNAPKDYNPLRTRKLLLKKAEIKSLIGKSKKKGLTLVPLKVYTKKGKIKLEIGLAKSKRKFEKREKIKEKDQEREMEREIKEL